MIRPCLSVALFVSLCSVSAVGAGIHPDPEPAVTSELETVILALRKDGAQVPKAFSFYQAPVLPGGDIIIDLLPDGLPKVLPFAELYGSPPRTLKPDCIKVGTLKPKVHLVKRGSLYQPSPDHKNKKLGRQKLNSTR